ncbi:hypothetical protein [Streptomyces sp. CBMA123]|uniref:hypothetical protein n=1 Tax=Streptomyces sp. CBMA123 TaxID=1896313 RepID=UPI002950048C|nr:hypothetical protein [Streptomyces sp. CBMA123]
MHVSEIFRLVRGNQHILDDLEVLHRDQLALRIHDGAFSATDLTARHPRSGELLSTVKFMVQTLAAGELQRDLQRELTYDGLRAAEAKGNKGGRRPVAAVDKAGTVRAAYLAGRSIAAVVARSTGLEVGQPHNGVYIAYEEGQFLDFHVDEFGYGEANLILCLKHTLPTGAPRVSTTVFINADGYLECDLAAGDCVVFDGALTPHGRTPLSAGESVALISFGFHARDQDPRTVTNLPPAPGQ